MLFSPTWAIKLPWNDSPSLLEMRRQRNKQNWTKKANCISLRISGEQSQFLLQIHEFCSQVNALEATDSLYAGILQKDTKSVSLRTYSSYSNCLFSVPGHVKVRRRSGSTSVAEDEHGKNFAPVQGLSNWFTLPRTQDTITKPLSFSCMFLLPSPTLTRH